MSEAQCEYARPAVIGKQSHDLEPVVLVEGERGDVLSAQRLDDFRNGGAVADDQSGFPVAQTGAHLANQLVRIRSIDGDGLQAKVLRRWSGRLARSEGFADEDPGDVRIGQ